MNNQRGDGSAPRCLLELVRPAPVIRQRFALKEFRIVGFRFADKQQGHLAFQVISFIVVPLLFRRVDAVAHKHNGCINIRQCRLRFVVGHVIIEVLQYDGRTSRWNDLERRGWKSFHPHHWHILKKSSIVSGGFQSKTLELRGDVIRRSVASLLAGAAPFQFIAGEILHRFSNSSRLDLRRLRFLRQNYARANHHNCHKQNEPAHECPQMNRYKNVNHSV